MRIRKPTIEVNIYAGVAKPFQNVELTFCEYQLVAGGKGF